MALPDFIVVGASKAGTSSMYHYLESHDEIYAPVKEPNFFALHDVDLPLNGPGDEDWYERSYTSEEEYRALLESPGTHQLVGEASPTYLHSRHAPENIHEYVPDAKLIMILRDPADRAFSHYRHFSESGLETESFQDAVESEKERLTCGWFWPRYIKAGRYYKQITRYLNYFSEEQLKIYLFSDFTSNTREVMVDVFRFLGVHPKRGPSKFVRRNVSGEPQHRLLEYLLSGRNPLSGVAKRYLPNYLRDIAIEVRNYNKTEVDKEMSHSIRKRIIEHLKDDIDRLEELLGKDLSKWKRY